MYSYPHLRSVAVTALLVSIASCSQQCDTVCQQLQDPSIVGSIGSTIESSIADGGNLDIILGRKIEGGGHESSNIWNIWAKALEVNSPSRISHISETGKAEDRVCIDKATLAKLTAAASGCHSHISGSGGSGSSGSMESGSSWSWSSTTGSTEHPTWGGSLTEPVLNEADGNNNIGGGGHQQPIGGQGNDKNSGGAGGIGSGSSTSNSDSQGSTSNSGSSFGSGSKGSTSNSGSQGTTSTSGWGHGNVNNANICFKIKDKRTERYLTSGGAEYAWAYYPQYYSVFRATPSKKVENGYTMTEINRSGVKVNYPVKLEPGAGQFKPYYGDTDAIWSFAPATFGDSCWGVPGKKMSRRHDWGGWGDNYRQVSSGGEDCADVELEEADC